MGYLRSLTVGQPNAYREKIAARGAAGLTLSARRSATEPHIVIDLHPDRAGRCYEVFWDTCGLADDMPFVAHGVVELLHRLLRNRTFASTLKCATTAAGPG